MPRQAGSCLSSQTLGVMSSLLRIECKNCSDPTFRVVAAFTHGNCVLCSLRLRHRSTEPQLPANPNEWSKSSKRSRGFSEAAGQSYTNEYYWCRKCGSPAVFTAETQRDTYEVQKKPVYQRRVLCDPCWKASGK
jgi:hypothetical protein